MRKRFDVPPRLAPVLARYPRRWRTVLRLALSDPAFRDLCDDLSEAHDSLNRLIHQFPGQDRPEFAEYTKLIEDLERDLLEQLVLRQSRE